MSKDMNLSVNGQSQVPPGFRFHPTEEELLHYYLRKKVASQKIDLDVIPDVDLNKLEPWDIQEKCRIGSTPQNDWYLFSHKDKKYPTGIRTNRATAAGFWKATGRDKVIYSNNMRIGMRKTLVFYKGRAPHGQKSYWIMHEYRLLDDSSHDAASASTLVGELGTSEDGWVVCRVFKKKNHHKALDCPQSLAWSYSNNNTGLLDHILTDMGSSSCKRQNETKNSNINSINISYAKMPLNGQINGSLSNGLRATQFLHLPALESQSTTEISSQFANIGSPLSQNHCSFSIAGACPEQSFEDMLTETEPPAACTNHSADDPNNTTVLPKGWVALDRLVASQLDGQVETSKRLTTACSYCTSYLNNLQDTLDDDHNGPPLSNLCSSIRPNDHQNSQVHGGDNGFWTNKHSSSSSSPCDPLCHWPV